MARFELKRQVYVMLLLFKGGFDIATALGGDWDFNSYTH